MRWTRWMGAAAVTVGCITAAVVVSCTSTTRQQETTAASDPAARIARGRYLAMVSGCNDCHTPGSLYGAPDTTRLLSGSDVGWTGPWGTTYARNLTPDSTGLAGWSEDDIVKAIRAGQRPDGSPVLPPMPWPAFAGLTDEDAHAIASFLKSIPPVNHPNVPRGAPGEKVPGALVFPPPPAWDAPRTPPAGAAGEAAAPESAGATH